jgi:hypothetical protein
VLIAVLLPSLRRARAAWAALCLANLKQQGVGFAAYGGDHKAYLPWVGSFRFSLMEGKYYLGLSGAGEHDWAAVNGGLLYPRYVGSTPEVFYCPTNKAADINGPTVRRLSSNATATPSTPTRNTRTHTTFPSRRSGLMVTQSPSSRQEPARCG